MGNNPEINNKGQEFQDIIKVKKEKLSNKQERQYEDAYQKYLELKKLNIDKEESEKRISEAINGKKNIDDILKAFNEEVDKIIEETSGLVDKLQGEVEKGVKDLKGKVAEEVKKTKDKMQDKAMEEGLGFIEKRIPGAKTFYKYFKNIGKAFEKVKESSSKGFMATVTAILGVFGVMFGKGKWWGKEVREGELQEEDEKKQVDTGGEDEEKGFNGEKSEIEGRKLEEKEMFYFKLGINSLLYFTGIDSSIDNKESIKKFKNKNLIELKEIKKTGYLDGRKLSNDDNEILDNLLSENTKILLISGLKEKIIKRTFNNHNNKLKQLLGGEYQKILESINNNNFKIENLSIKAIGILLIFSINSFGLLTIEGVGSKFEEVFDIFGDQDFNFASIKEELKGKKEGIISKKLLQALNENHTIYKLKATTDNTKIKTQLKDFEDKEELNKLLDFKDWLLGNEFLGNNSKTLLGKFNKSDIFKQNLTYAGVIALYTIFGGQTNIENMSTIELPVLYKLLSIIIGKGSDAGHGSDYITSVIGYFATSKEENIFKNKNDKKALEIMTKRLIKTYVRFIMNEIRDKLGIVGLFSNKIENDVMAIVLGIGMGKLGGNMMKKGFIFQGAWLKKLGRVALLSGAASLIDTTYNKGSELFKELSSFGKEDFSDMTEEQVKDYLNKAEELNKRIFTKKIEIDGQPKEILLFSSKYGLEVVYNGKIFKLGVGFSRFGDIETIARDIMTNLSGLIYGSFDTYLRDELPSEVSDFIIKEKEAKDYWKNKDFKFKGKKYNFSKVKIEGDYIYVGEGLNILKLDLEDFLVKVVKSKIEYPEKLASSEKNKNISYKIIEPGSDETHNLILIQQGIISKK